MPRGSAELQPRSRLEYEPSTSAMNSRIHPSRTLSNRTLTPFVERALAIAALLLPASCHLVLSDIELADDPTAGGGTPSSTSSSTTADAGGTTGTSAGGTTSGGTTSASGGSAPSGTGCQGTTGYYCASGTLINCATKVQTPCGAASLCDGKAGKCYECNPGQYTCQGSNRMSCSSTRTWQLDTACSGDTPFCEAPPGECVTCPRGATRCSGTAAVERCSTERVWTSYTTCNVTAYPKGCVQDSLTAAHCVDCNPATFVPSCVNATLMSCPDDHVVPTTCPNVCVPATSTAAAQCQ